MKKRMVKKLAKRAAARRLIEAEIEIKDLIKTIQFMSKTVGELEEKCTRYVEESIRYRELYKEVARNLEKEINKPWWKKVF